MGSNSSHMRGRPSKPNRTRRLLSSLICGASTSQSPSEVEEYPAKSLISSVENLAPVTDELYSSRADSTSDSGFNSSKTELVASSETESSTGSIEDNFFLNGLRNIQASNPSECPLKCKESVSHQENASCCCKEAYINKNSATASTSYKDQPYVESASANLGNGLDAAAESHNSAKREASIICPDDINSSSVDQEQLTGNFAENNENTVMGLNTSASGSLSVLPDSLLSLQLFGDSTAHVALPSASGFLVSDSDRDLRSGGVLQVDVVSITSNILASSSADISNREARRNSRRLFWDALSRRSFRRHNDSPTIVFTTGHAVDLGSRDRWLLDLSGDLHYDGVGHEFEYLGSGRHRRNDRYWQLRSEMSERHRSDLDGGGRPTLCPSGLHPGGTCACDSYFMGEESSTFTSITRIVMLSEALFEVLDGIHHQPSMLSVPAPEFVVNSFPLKNHKMSSETESEPSDVKQCYICLVEYEEGDEIRVLPCHHEYHMKCVDKWLKEIHGVCPLCRCNVCEGISRGATSNTEVPSH